MPAAREPGGSSSNAAPAPSEPGASKALPAASSSGASSKNNHRAQRSDRSDALSDKLERLRKHPREEFFEKDPLFPLCVDRSGVGCFLVDAVTDEAKWSAMIYALHDLEPSGDRARDRAVLYTRIHPEDRERFVETRQASIKARTGAADVLYRVIWRDGTVLRLAAHWDVVGSLEKGDLRLIGTIVDTTDLWILQQQETEHLLTKKTLEEERRRREEVQRLLRTMSHEVRGPLQGIMSNARLLLEQLEDLIEQTPDEPVELSVKEALTMRSCLEDTVECATHQLLCINDFLDEVAQRKERLIRADPVDIEAIVCSVASMFKTAARDKGITLEWAPGGIVVVGDGVLLKRVLMNLVSNSLKFSDSGVVKIIVKHDGSSLTVQVVDEGRGVPDEFRDKLFYESGLTTTNQDFVAGSGLGLCICRHLVEQMQGTIGFNDNSPRGSVFGFTVPAERISVTVSPTPVMHGLRRGRGPRQRSEYLRGRRVLCAEDNRINQRVLRHMLEPLALSLTIVNDGHEALEQFAAGSFDVVLLDYHMPRMNGVEAAKRLRSGLWTSPLPASSTTVPIIFLTGELPSEVQGRISGMQPCALLLKPASITDIIAACKKLLPPSLDHKSTLADTSSRSTSPETKSLSQDGDEGFSDSYDEQRMRSAEEGAEAMAPRPSSSAEEHDSDETVRAGRAPHAPTDAADRKEASARSARQKKRQHNPLRWFKTVLPAGRRNGEV